jgi:hypothetical protein
MAIIGSLFKILVLILFFLKKLGVLRIKDLGRDSFTERTKVSDLE